MYLWVIDLKYTVLSYLICTYMHTHTRTHTYVQKIIYNLAQIVKNIISHKLYISELDLLWRKVRESSTTYLLKQPQSKYNTSKQ